MEIFDEINNEDSYESLLNISHKDISNCISSKSTDSSFSNNTETFQKKLIKDSSEIRMSYMKKLFNHNLPIIKNSNICNAVKRKYNSLIFFDWDDTLLCSSFLIEYSQQENKKNILNQKNNSSYKNYLNNLENIVYNLLQTSINYGDTYIITNASKNWVIYSSFKFFPKVIQLFNKIRIISARDAYENEFPNQTKFWKLAVFMDIANLYNKNVVTNIISIGDSSIENEAASKLSYLFTECYIKTIKFQEEPKPYHLLKQLKLVLKKFIFLHSAVRNISIKIEKKSCI